MLWHLTGTCARATTPTHTRASEAITSQIRSCHRWPEIDLEELRHALGPSTGRSPRPGRVVEHLPVPYEADHRADGAHLCLERPSTPVSGIPAHRSASFAPRNRAAAVPLLCAPMHPTIHAASSRQACGPAHATEEAGRHSPLANRGDPERHAHGRTGLYVGPLLAPNVFSP